MIKEWATIDLACFISDESMELTWGQLFRAAHGFSSLISEKCTAGDRVLIVESAPIPEMICSLACMINGVIPCFGTELGSTNLKTLSMGDETPLSLIDKTASSLEVTEIFDAIFKRQGVVLCFSTSGSTGEPTNIEKSWNNLLNEVKTLQDLYSMDEKKLCLSLIQPSHIYGYLHTFLLPLFSSCSVYFSKFEMGKIRSDKILRSKIGCLITVPAQWSALKQLLPTLEVGIVVTSGAPFGDNREKEFISLDTKAELFELLGSTETGGIAYQRVGRDHGIFHLFESVRLVQEDGGTKITSDYISDETYLSDNVSLLEGGRSLIHKGRADRIIKYGSKRIHLSEIERCLREVTNAKTILCFFREQKEAAKGGVLIAYLEAPAQDINLLRQEYAKKFSTPFPSEIYFVKNFPQDSNGKVTFASLQKAEKGM